MITIFGIDFDPFTSFVLGTGCAMLIGIGGEWLGDSLHDRAKAAK